MTTEEKTALKLEIKTSLAPGGRHAGLTVEDLVAKMFAGLDHTDYLRGVLVALLEVFAEAGYQAGLEAAADGVVSS